ncbi:MAG: guanylate kinase [Nitrospira bacterium HGW-Nitrospira-1]|nr:MAG: guanylate kinase [Nitrospira bacterium HGW-Nitrospira-1]
MEKKDRGSIFIVSAPSGTGKTTLCKQIISAVDNIKPSVSFTTRLPRPGEIPDEDYCFVSEKEFRDMIHRGDFVEWAQVHGSLYGTSRRKLEELISVGYDVLLDIDTQGARQFRKFFNNAVYIFILPPSMKELKHRLEGRMSNSVEDMNRRLQAAVDEIREYKMYDYVIINDIIKTSLKKLEAIIIAERLRSNKIDPHWIENI